MVHPTADRGDDDDTREEGSGNGMTHAVSEDGASGEHAQSSVNSSVFVLAATTLGAGILALPYAMSVLGWLFGSLLLIAIGCASSYSIRLLLRTAETVGATTYEELGHAIFPKFGRRMVVACTLVLIFGSLTAFFVIIADTITPAVQNIVGGSDPFFTHREVLLVIVAITVVYPLCLLRSIHALERWSFLAVGIILTFSVIVIIDAIRVWARGEAGPDADGNNPDIGKNVGAIEVSWKMFEAIPIICLAFTCQTMVFPIWNALIGGSGRGPTETETGLAPPSRMGTVVNRSLVVCGLLYLPVGCFGFLLFGQSTKGDVLNNFSTTSTFWDVVRLGFTLAICIHYPVVHFGFRTAILQTWFGAYTDAQNLRRFHVLTVLAVVASLGLALALPNLSTVFGLTGALCAFPYCFMFPTLFYLHLHRPGAQVLYLRGPRARAAEAAAAEAAAASAGGEGLVHASGSFGSTGGGGGYQPLHNHDDSRNGLASIEVDSVSPSGRVHHASPLLPPSGLSPAERIPAYTLLGVTAFLWLVSIGVCFKDMVQKLSEDGIE